MAAKRMDLNKRSFFVLSGITNPLGSSLALEFCRRFHADSTVLLIDECEEQLQTLKKLLQEQQPDLRIKIAAIGDWQLVNKSLFRNLLLCYAAINNFEEEEDQESSSTSSHLYERALIVHNEGTAATHELMEPQNSSLWSAYVQQNLYAPVALNQAFLEVFGHTTTEKLVINVRSSLQVQPFVYNQLLCSCKKARDMYFRAMASEEWRQGVSVLNYAPGVLETHKPQLDINANLVDLMDLDVNAAKLPRIKPLQSTLALINILEEISFISGHDVDYYDTFNL